MTTVPTRQNESRRDLSRQAAFSFLSNISLGTESNNNKKISASGNNATNRLGNAGQYQSTGRGEGGGHIGENTTNEQSSTSRDESIRTAKTISQIAVDKEIHADQGASDMREGDDPNIKDQKSEKGKSITVHGKYTETECEAESHQKDSSFDSVSPTPSPPNGYQSSSRIAQLHDGDDQLDLEISLYDNDSGSPNNASPTGAGKFSLLKGRREKSEKAASYAHLLVPGNGLDSDEYNPVLLDDPTLKMGRRRRMISLLPFMGSNTQYTRSSEQKREANEKFRKRHPYLDPTMSLSKIRTVKEKLLLAARNENLGVDLELSTVAMTYAYFEKLVLKNFVNKPNRRLVAGICLFLASKTNEPRGMTFGPLLQSIDKYFDVDEKEIKEHEFSVFVALGFQLYLPNEEFMPHFDRIFQSLGK